MGAEFCCIFLNVQDNPKCARTNFGESRAIRTVEVRQSMKIAKVLIFKKSKFEFSKNVDSVFRIMFLLISSIYIYDIRTLATKEINLKLENIKF